MPTREVTLQGRMEDGLFVVESPHAQFPLRMRTDTSDPHVFYQIFIGREYACLDDVGSAELIIDCGANVGYSAAYFLSRYPQSRVIAVEPEAANFQLMCQNLAPYGDRAKSLQTGVWSHSARLTIAENRYRDGRSWARQVRECRADENGGFEAVDIGSLLAGSGSPRISILKIDVEGAEAVIFARNYEHWLDCVDNLVIELHDDSSFGKASPVFAKAIDGRGFVISRYQELIVCKRPLGVAAPAAS
jgi:FkbM family methyltransferase